MWKVIVFYVLISKDVLEEVLQRIDDTLSDSTIGKQRAKTEKEIATIEKKTCRYVFESIVEKVIVGGIDEEGDKDPAQLILIYKPGLKNSVDGDKFKPQRKMQGADIEQ